MSNYEVDIEAHIFAGHGDNAQLAADAAARSLNEWAPFKKWRDYDGKSVYTVTTTIQRVDDGWWVCVLTVTGPVPKE